MVSALNSGASDPGVSPGRGHCVVFLGKTLYSHSASLHLQSRTKVVGTLELGHISPIPPNQCWKISRFFRRKEKKSPDYQHCKWGEGRACSLSQPFCPGLSKKRI